MEMYHPEIEQEDEMVDGPKPPGFYLCEKDESIAATKQSTPRKVRIQRANTQLKFNFKLDYTTDLMQDETSPPVREMDSAPDVFHVTTVPADGLAPNGARPSAGAVLNAECEKQNDETEQQEGELGDTLDIKQGEQGAVSIRKTVLPGMAIPMLKIRRPNGRLIFNMEIAIRR